LGSAARTFAVLWNQHRHSQVPGGRAACRRARQVIDDANTITFFYDQIFAEAPGATKRTSWHQDLPFLPVRGDQLVRQASRAG
jgi:hypothetical protein